MKFQHDDWTERIPEGGYCDVLAAIRDRRKQGRELTPSEFAGLVLGSFYRDVHTSSTEKSSTHMEKKLQYIAERKAVQTAFLYAESWMPSACCSIRERDKVLGAFHRVTIRRLYGRGPMAQFSLHRLGNPRLGTVLKLAEQIGPEKFSLLVSDMEKLPHGFACWLWCRLSYRTDQMANNVVENDFGEREVVPMATGLGLWDHYIHDMQLATGAIKKAPTWFTLAYVGCDHFLPKELPPTTLGRRILTLAATYHAVLNHTIDPFNTDNSVLQLYHKLHPTSRKKPHPASRRAVRDMLRWIQDGHDLHARYPDLTKEVQGHGLRVALERSAYNHHQEAVIRAKDNEKRTADPTPMPCSLSLPEDLEGLRLVTRGAMVKAGIECQHCIGGYTNSHDLFFRKDNVCAQVDRKLRVVQCYDKGDRVTRKSKDFENWLKERLASIKEAAHAAKVPAIAGI